MNLSVQPPRPSSAAVIVALLVAFVIAALAGATSVAASDPMAGQVVAWGQNTLGELGTGDTLDRELPVAVDRTGALAGKTIVQIAASWHLSCALDSVGAVYCWGANSGGMLGNGSLSDSPTPIAVDMSGALAGKTIVQIDLGQGTACVLDSTGRAYCWGSDNGSGMLGRGDGGDSPVPVAVDMSSVAGENFAQISVGDQNACGLTPTGQLYCWGMSYYLGDGQGVFGGPGVDRPRLINSGLLADRVLTGVSIGSEETCVIDASGAAYCWGRHDFGQLGDGQSHPFNADGTPVTMLPVAVDTSGVLAGRRLTQISIGAVGQFLVCALDSAGLAYCWGGVSSVGLVGNDGSGNSSVPMALDTSGALNGKVLTSISVGWQLGLCATDSAGSAYCWNGAPAQPVDTSGVLAGQSVKQISVGAIHILALVGAPTPAPLPAAQTAFRTSIPTPWEINLSPVVVAETAAVAVGIIVLVPFPGSLFNSTLEANYAEIIERVRRLRRRGRDLLLGPWDRLRHKLGPSLIPLTVTEAASQTLDRDEARQEGRDFWAKPYGVGLFILLTALLTGFLDPGFGVNVPSIATFVGMSIGLLIVLAAFHAPIAIFYRRRSIGFGLRALPATVAVSIVCVLISRLTNFSPGYLYGLVIAMVASHELDKRTEGKLMAVATLTTVVAAVLAWFGLGLLSPLVSTTVDPGPPLIVAQTVLTVVVAAGVEVAAFGLLPVSFLAGESVRRWNQPAWAALWAIGLLAFGIVILNPQNGYLSDTTRTPLLTVVALLVFFSAVSLLFWYSFHRRTAPR